jgi:iron complex outermembrane receptor protein
MVSSLLTRAVAAALLLPAAAFAQTTTPAAGVTLDTVNVAAAHPLDTPAPTGTRLGLSSKETPATLDRIGADRIEQRGYRSVQQAVESLPGITAGSSPANLAQFSMRGFTNEQIMMLNNGLYIGPSNMVGRPQNAFNLADIEVLKGPASVLYGQGAVGGTINVVNKKPSFDPASWDALLGVGRYGTLNTGLGGGAPLSDTVAVRGDISRNSTQGYVDRGHADSFSGSFSLLWRPSASFSVLAALDVLNDNPSDYYGVPLLPAGAVSDPLHGVVNGASGLAIDRRTRYRNYNVGDADNSARQYFPRIQATWKPTDAVTIENTAYYIYATRKFINSESYVYDVATGRIDRDRFFVLHDQHLAGDRLTASVLGNIFGLANRFVVGADYSHLDFVRGRGFPDGDSVDLLDPQAGSFGPLQERKSPTYWDDTALFFEDALDLAPGLKLVAGARAERLWLDRQNYNVDGSFQASTSFHHTYGLFNWRTGLVYDINRVWSVYGQYSTGQDPVGSNIFLVNAGQNFKLSNSRQAEIGLKAAGDQGEVTLALYNIHRDNILTQTGQDSASNAGSQRSRGIELSAAHRITRDWLVDANAAYTDARYGTFIDTNTGIDASGHRPLNVPRWTANLQTSVQHIGGLPWEIGGGFRYVGRRYANFANTTAMLGYTTTDVYTSYAVTPQVTLSFRIENLFNKTYAQWADPSYPSELLLGAPRTYEVSVVAHF